MGLDLVIHGHIHRGVDELVYLDGIPVYNVSLPARGRVVYIKFEETIMSKKSRVSGLDKWFKT